MGIPLYAIPDIRRFYGRPDPYGKDPIDFIKETYPQPQSHVIAARITAENPDEVRWHAFLNRSPPRYTEEYPYHTLNGT